MFLLLFFQGYGGKSFAILTDEELLNYLSSNISKEEKTPPLNAEDLKNMNMSELVSTMQPYVQSFNNIGSKKLCRAFELGKLLFHTKEIYNHETRNRNGFVPYIKTKVSLSKSWINKLIDYYCKLHRHPLLNQCNISITTMMQLSARITLLIDNSDAFKDFYNKLK